LATSTDNVGIGTSDPLSKLHLRGDDFVNLRFDHGSDTTWKIGSSSPGNSLTISVHTPTFATLRASFTPGGDIHLAPNGGNVGIGTTNPAYKLDVNGDINCSGSYNVKKGGVNYIHPDYVFETDYDLMSLDELRKHVAQNKCLPNVISAEDVKKNNGFKMDELMIQMLEKIEEQTLYIFQLEERISKLEKERQSK